MEFQNFDSRFGFYVKFPARGQMYRSKIEFLASTMKRNRFQTVFLFYPFMGLFSLSAVGKPRKTAARSSSGVWVPLWFEKYKLNKTGFKKKYLKRETNKINTPVVIKLVKAPNSTYSTHNG